MVWTGPEAVSKLQQVYIGASDLLAEAGLQGRAGQGMDLEEGQEVLNVGTVAQGSARGLVWQPVQVLGWLQDAGAALCQQLQQPRLTAALQALKSCQRPYRTCTVKSCRIDLTGSVSVVWQAFSRWLYSARQKPCRAADLQLFKTSWLPYCPRTIPGCQSSPCPQLQQRRHTSGLSS